MNRTKMAIGFGHPPVSRSGFELDVDAEPLDIGHSHGAWRRIVGRGDAHFDAVDRRRAILVAADVNLGGRAGLRRDDPQDRFDRHRRRPRPVVGESEAFARVNREAVGAPDLGLSPSSP